MSSLIFWSKSKVDFWEKLILWSKLKFQGFYLVLIIFKMVPSFKLEHKLNDDANFKGMHLYMLFMLCLPAKHECILQGMYKRPCPRSDLGFSTFIGTSS
jgi:hypothetical protein